MPKKTVYESKLAVFRTPMDGYRHLAVSVIQRAIEDVEHGTEKMATEARTFLLTDAPVWAAIAGGDKEAVKEALCKKYGT